MTDNGFVHCLNDENNFHWQEQNQEKDSHTPSTSLAVKFIDNNVLVLGPSSGQNNKRVLVSKGKAAAFIIQRMKMQKPVAPPDYAIIILTIITICFIFWTHATYGRNAVIITGEKSRSFRLKAVDFETIKAHGVFEPSNWTARGRKRVRIRAMILIHLGLRLLLANVWSQGKEMDKIGLRLAKQCEFRDCCAHRDLPPPPHLGSSCCTRRADRVLRWQSKILNPKLFCICPDVFSVFQLFIFWPKYG